MATQLEKWLTHRHLEEIAGRLLVQNARSMLLRGEVRFLARKGNVLTAEVGGGTRYDVSLEADADGLFAICGCPAFYQRGFCKHAVALGLTWLEREQASPPSRPSPPPAGAPHLTLVPPTGVPPTAPRPTDRAGILAWLAAHGIAYAQRLPLAVLLPHLPRPMARLLAAYPLIRLPLLGAMEADDRSHLSYQLNQLLRGQTRVLREAAWTFLEAEAACVARGLAAEAARAAAPVPAPTDARLVPLVEALLRARAVVREHAVPRGEGAPARDVTWLEAPPRIISRESAAAVPGESWQHSVPVEVTLRLVELLGSPDAVSCNCVRDVPARCNHVLSALDDALATLVSPAHAAANARLADAVFSRGWVAVLDALERTALPPAERGADTSAPREYSFRVCGLSSGVTFLKAYVHSPTKKGGWTKGVPLSPRERAAARERLSPGEAAALELMSLDATSEQQRRALPHLLQLLAGSARLFLEERLDVPAQVRTVPLGFTFVEEEDGAVRAQPSLDGEPVGHEALLAAAARAPEGGPWLLTFPDRARLLLVRAPPGAVEVLCTLREYLPRFPADALPALTERLGQLERVFPVTLPASLEARRVAPEDTLLLRLVPTEEGGLKGSLFTRPLPEAPPQVPGEGPALLRALRGGERVAVERALTAERAAADALLARLEVQHRQEGATFALPDARTALDLLERLEPVREQGLEVEWPERAWRLLGAPRLSQVKVEVKTKRDWFGVEGGVEVDGERLQLAALLDAARRGERYVALGKDRFLRLTEELRAQLAPLADITWEGRQGLEVSRAAAPVLEELRAAGGAVEAPPAWLTLSRTIREVGRRKVAVPRGLKAELRDYQREGFEWMARLCEWGAGGCLADDMGLGKTVQALALLLHRAKRGPALVVAPTSVCPNWLREAERFAPGLEVTLYHEADREAALAALGPRHVLVVSYALLAQDAERFAAVPFATLVVDEAQAVKNPDTARARALRGVQAAAKVALSGTPVENRLSELWSLFTLLFPGLLGSREAFRERYGAPIEKERDPLRRAALARALRPFLLRRTKAQVARELPPRLEVTVPVALSSGELRLYEDARLAAIASLGGGLPGDSERFRVLAAITRLRMLACHPRLGDASSVLPSSKTARLLELVASVRSEGGRALVFSQFVKHLALVREALEAQGVPLLTLDGSTPAPERARRVEAFQRGEGDVFLISLKAGGTGLNLTGADHVIHLDPWWNPAVEDQATDRAHRIGQTKPVTVTRLISEGTIEEAILGLHAEKRDLAASLLSEADGAAALSAEQLMALLRFTGEASLPGAGEAA